MRMRKKKNLAARMEQVSSLLVANPESLKGNWRTAYPGFLDIHIELGCGKGKFTVETAKANPDILFIAIERVPEAMIIAMERASEASLENVLFIDMDVSSLRDVIGTGEVGRIYINFCDPWPKAKHAKRRLTSPSFLKDYRMILRPDGDIHFKTDNSELFMYSVEQFELNAYILSDVTENLHKGSKNGVMTDYEEKFYEQGKPIFRLEARPGEHSAKTGGRSDREGVEV